MPGVWSLSMTESSTSEGWARKTNFKEDGEDPIQATVPGGNKITLTPPDGKLNQGL